MFSGLLIDDAFEFVCKLIANFLEVNSYVRIFNCIMEVDEERGEGRKKASIKEGKVGTPNRACWKIHPHMAVSS